MMKQVLVALATLAFCFSAMPAEADPSCSLMNQLKTCFPNITRFMERPMTLSVVVLALGSSSNMPAIERRCVHFTELNRCVENGMSSCSSASDASTPAAQFWQNAKVGVDYMCGEHKDDFIRNQECMSNNELRQGAKSCEVSDDHHRRKRHTCSDYEQEVTCADRLIARHCGSEAAKHAGHILRIFLKNTPTTKDCKAPAFSSADGMRSTFTALLSFSATSVALAMRMML